MSELAAFKRALDAAGQPWNRLGVRLIGAGIVALAVVQVIPPSRYAVYALPFVLTVIAAGWILMIVAFIKRRVWAQRNPVEPVALPDIDIHAQGRLGDA